MGVVFQDGKEEVRKGGQDGKVGETVVVIFYKETGSVRGGQHRGG